MNIGPILILGGLADFAREKLLADYSDKYALPELVKSNSNMSSGSGSKEKNLSMTAGSSDTSHLDSLDELERMKMMKKQLEVEEDDEELQMASNQMNNLNLKGYQQQGMFNDSELNCNDLTKQRHENDELRNLDKNFDLNCFTGSLGKNSPLKLSSSFLNTGLGNGDLFSNPLTNDSNKNSKSSNSASNGIIKLSSIKSIIDKGKHALLDVTPQAVNRLNYAQLYPIVIYLKAESKSIIKELRIRHNKTNVMNLNSNNSNGINASNLNQNQKSSRKIFEDCVKLEKNWSSIFTATINLTTADVWYKKLRETIEKQQQSNIWVTSSTPDSRIADDFLVLPVQNNRLSYASSPESDMDLSLGSNLNNNNANNLIPCSTNSFTSNHLQPSTSGLTGRLAKACSVPSIATIDDLSINQTNFQNSIKYKDNINSTIEPVFSNHLAPNDSSTPTSFQMPKTPIKQDRYNKQNKIQHQQQQIKQDEEEDYYSKKANISNKINSQTNGFGNLMNGNDLQNNYLENNTTSSDDPNSAIPTPNQLNGNNLFNNNQLNQVQNRNSMCNNIMTNGTLINKNNQINEDQVTNVPEPPRINRGIKPSRFKNGIINEIELNNHEQQMHDQMTNHPLPVINNGYNQNNNGNSGQSSTTHQFITANGNLPIQDYMNSPNSKQAKRKSTSIFLENNNNSSSATNNSSPYSSNYVSPTNTLDNRTSAMSNGSSNLNGNQFNQNGYQTTIQNGNNNQMTNGLMNGNPSMNYPTENGFNNGNNLNHQTYLPIPPSIQNGNNNKFTNALIPPNSQIDHLNVNQSPRKLKPPTPPPKHKFLHQPLKAPPNHYQRTIDLPGYYPTNGTQDPSMNSYLNPLITNPNNLPPPIPSRDHFQQQYQLNQARRRLPYNDPNVDSLYMTTTPNGLVNYQPQQELRNSYVPHMSNGMPNNMRAMQQLQQQQQMSHQSQGPYLNVPQPRQMQQQNQQYNLMMNGNNVNQNGLIDLSSNRDQRSSAFELYRKPQVNNNQMNQYPQNPILNGHQQMINANGFYGLPPPSPK